MKIDSIRTSNDMFSRNRLGFFVQAGQETTDGCIGKKHFFTK